MKAPISASFVVVAIVVSQAAGVDLRLIDAVKARNAAAVGTLLKERVDIRVDINARQGDGATALHWAVHLNDAGIVDLLLKAGAKSDVADDTGVTPLYLACLNREGGLVERLLQARANPNAALASGETVLMTCARTGESAGCDPSWHEAHPSTRRSPDMIRPR